MKRGILLSYWSLKKTRTYITNLTEKVQNEEDNGQMVMK